MHELIRWSHGTLYVNGWMLLAIIAMVAVAVLIARVTDD